MIFPSKVQNLTVFPITYMIRLRFLGRWNYFRRGFRRNSKELRARLSGFVGKEAGQEESNGVVRKESGIEEVEEEAESRKKEVGRPEATA